jgi:hypothetical protein
MISTATRGIRKLAAPTVLAMILWAPPELASGQTIMGAEAARKYNEKPLTVAIPPNVTPQDVEEVMARALTGRKWTVVQQSPQEVVGTLNHRDCQAKVMLRVDGNVVKIVNESLCKSNTRGFEPAKSPNTEAFEPAIPRGWLRNLEKDMNAHFAAKAARK